MRNGRVKLKAIVITEQCREEFRERVREVVVKVLG